jgi:AraC family transcriptional regulator
MSEQLKTGQFYGRSVRKLEHRGLVLSEIEHKVGKRVPEHEHQSAYFSLMLSGGYAETFRSGRMTDYAPLTVGYHPPRNRHLDVIGAKGARFFSIELRDEALARHAECVNAEHAVPDLHGGDMTWLSLKLHRAFVAETLDQLDLETLSLEMLAQAARQKQVQETFVPVWMRRCRELLHAEFARPLTIEHVAEQVGVHPVHLSRTFRSTYKQTLGEYLNNLRVQAASQLMQHGLPLAIVAAECGFADQSHFCRVYKAITGDTPSAFRAAYC